MAEGLGLKVPNNPRDTSAGEFVEVVLGSVRQI